MWSRRLTTILVLAAGCLAAIAPDDVEDAAAAERVLESRGLERKGSWFLLPAEREVPKALRTVKDLERAVQQAEKVVDRAQRQMKGVEREIDDIMWRRRQLTDRLSTLSDPNRYNEVVASINRMTVRLDELMRIRLVHLAERDAELDRREFAAREALVGCIVGMRRQVDDAQRRYEAVAADPEVLSAVATLVRIHNRPFNIGPSRRFAGVIRGLERRETAIVSERVPLRREGNVFWVMASLNGEAATEMVFDTGASQITLPTKIAMAAGLEPGPDDPPVRLLVADGREVEARRMTLSSVRVGKFEVENVPCVVLPVGLHNAPALLGGSFLNHFTYHIDTAAAEVVLYRLETDSKKKTRGRSTGN